MTTDFNRCPICGLIHFTEADKPCFTCQLEIDEINHRHGSNTPGPTKDEVDFMGTLLAVWLVALFLISLISWFI